MKQKIQTLFHFSMSKLPAKTNGLLLWFCRKATFSGVFTNYVSFIFDIYKKGLFHTPLSRFFKVCFSTENFHKEVHQLKIISKCNNYLVNIIDQYIQKFLDKLYVPKQIVPTVTKKKLLVVYIFKNIFFQFEKTFI